MIGLSGISEDPERAGNKEPTGHLFDVQAWGGVGVMARRLSSHAVTPVVRAGNKERTVHAPDVQIADA